MSNPFDPALMEELLQRELAKERNRPAIAQPSRPKAGPAVEPLSPSLVSLVGGLADSASTYTFLKRGTGREDNKLVAGLANKSPEALTALGAAANVAVPFLLKKLGKKFPKVANAVMANQGALQMGYGSLNTQNTLSPGRVRDAVGSKRTSTRYSNAIMTELSRRQK